uniref:hypothetical protein n=1 Tax=Synechococcus sp. UW106 TaxID=368495 RepID=UPI0010BD2F80|nr:hypothetical protein [Synechococcus sp. UW106]
MARWTVDAMAEQARRFALVTGAKTGIGFEAALQLACKGKAGGADVVAIHTPDKISHAPPR